MASDRHFYTLFVSNDTDESPQMVFGDPDQEDGPAEDGTYRVIVRYPDPTDAHIALGRFMDAWSRAERVAGMLFQDLTGTPPRLAPVILNNLGARGLIDSLLALAALRGDDDISATIKSLAEQLGSINSKRNYIVHGYWILEVRFFRTREGISHSEEVLRAYDPSDPIQAKALRQKVNQKERARFLWSPKRLHDLSGDLDRLRSEMQDLHDTMRQVFGADGQSASHNMHP